MTREIIPGIYAIKNKINNYMYIGSSVNILSRFSDHKTELKFNRHHSAKLQNSYNKHGLSNYEFLILEVVKTNGSKNVLMKKLRALEQAYVDHFETYKNDKGYNMNKKVSGSYRELKDAGIPVYKYDAYIGKFIEEYKNLNEASIKNNIPPGTISKNCKGKPKFCKGGFIWRFKKDVKDKDNIIVVVVNKGKSSVKPQILKYSLENGKFIDEFDSAREASINIGAAKSGNQIAEACKKGGYIALGYFWKYKTSNIIELQININETEYQKKDRKFLQYNVKTGVFIKQWNNVKEIREFYKLSKKNNSTISCILDCCR